MKRVLLSLAAILGTVAIVPVLAFADPAPSTFISGYVLSGTSGINGASVTVNCNGNLQTATTSDGGSYLVQFPIAQCAKNSAFSVSATSGPKTGSGSGTIVKQTNKLNVNVEGSGNVALPEMGVVASIAALVCAGGTFAIVRRHKQADQN